MIDKHNRERTQVISKQKINELYTSHKHNNINEPIQSPSVHIKLGG